MTEVKNAKHILKSVRGRNKQGNKAPLAYNFGGKIMKAYFKEAKELVFNGYKIDFPLKFGTMYIRQSDLKSPIKKSKVANTKIEDYNIKRLGKMYNIVIEGDFIRKNGYKFKPTNEDRKRLAKILCNTDIEYRTSLI